MQEDLQRHVGKFYGKYSGEVVKNDTDKENMGRIVVKVPSVFGRGAEVTARPCLPYGHFFVPPVGAKVWIEFEGGHSSSPIWVGTWYPQGTTPAKGGISPPDNRVIQTASGHVIEIMDKLGEEKITIKHKGNAFISIDKKGSVLIANQSGSYVQLDALAESATIVEQHGNVITMNKDGIVITQKSGKAAIQLTDDAVRIMGGSIILQAPSVSLTGDATAEPTFLATSLAAQWNLFANHLHANSGRHQWASHAAGSDDRSGREVPEFRHGAQMSNCSFPSLPAVIVPSPVIPGVPKLPQLPALPRLPTPPLDLPATPALPSLALPSPVVPGLPKLPVPPKLPRLPTPPADLPAKPSLPSLALPSPVVPGLPKLPQLPPLPRLPQLPACPID